MTLQALAEQPFELLLELERLARASTGSEAVARDSADEWVGIAFRLRNDQFVADRSDVREIMPIPEQPTRVPGAKSWLRGVANVRGQLLTVVDLRGYLGAAGSQSDRRGRVLVLASRDVPTGVIVDEVFGFRRFPVDTFERSSPKPELRCEQYVNGVFKHGAETWPRFDFPSLLRDPQFLNVGEERKA